MYGQGHPDMQNAKAQLSQVQTRISEELSRASIGLQAEAAARRSREAQLAGEMGRSEEHTSELQSLMRISYAVFCLKKKKTPNKPTPPPKRNMKKHHNNGTASYTHYTDAHT